jgi:hypothetical protein
MATSEKTSTRTYISWSEMKQRCTNINKKDYARYGAIGITYHPSWENYDTFLSDMGHRPEGHTLDRYPNNKGNYEPGNCRWATPEQQANNTRKNKMFTFCGETKSVSQWARDFGLTVNTLWGRIVRGIPFEIAIQKKQS